MCMVKMSSVKKGEHKFFIIALLLTAVFAVGYSPIITGQTILETEYTITTTPQEITFPQYRHINLIDGDNTYSILVHRVTKGRDAISFQIFDGNQYYYQTVKTNTLDYKVRSVVLDNGVELVFTFIEVHNRQGIMSLYKK